MNKKVIIGISIGVIIFKFIVPNVTGSKTIELTYKTNGGVPYKWEYQIEDESIAQFVEAKDITPEQEKKMVGATISTNYVFKGVKEGKTTITFKYVNIISNVVEKEEKFTVKVDKHKNISLVANP